MRLQHAQRVGSGATREPDRCRPWPTTGARAVPALMIVHSSPPGSRRGASRAARILGHAVLLTVTGALLTSIAGAAVIAAPVLLPLLFWAGWRTRSALRWLYLILAAVIVVEAAVMIYNTVNDIGRSPARPVTRATVSQVADATAGAR